MELHLRTEEYLLLQAAEAYGWTAPRDEPFAYLVARHDPEDDRLVAGLERAGFAVIRLPLLETAPGRDAAKLASRLSSLEPGTALAWTSRRAAAALAQAALPRHRALLERTPLFALGAASAAPLAAQGLRVETPSGGENAATLGRFVAERAAGGAIRRVLFLAGNRSLPDFEEALSAAGGAKPPAAERLEVYETRALAADLRPLRDALASSRLACAVFFSPSAAETLADLLEPEWLARLHRVPAAARGPTTAAAIRAMGFRSVDAGLRAVTPRRSHPLAFLALHLMDHAELRSREPR